MDYIFPAVSGFGECFRQGWANYVSPNAEKKHNNTKPNLHPSLHITYMEKGLTAGEKLENHASGTAYGIVRTAVVCAVSSEMKSITACA